MEILWQKLCISLQQPQAIDGFLCFLGVNFKLPLSKQAFCRAAGVSVSMSLLACPLWKGGVHLPAFLLTLTTHLYVLIITSIATGQANDETPGHYPSLKMLSGCSAVAVFSKDKLDTPYCWTVWTFLSIFSGVPCGFRLNQWLVSDRWFKCLLNFTAPPKKTDTHWQLCPSQNGCERGTWIQHLLLPSLLVFHGVFVDNLEMASLAVN